MRREMLLEYSGRKKILLIDDSGVFLRTIKNLLDSKYDVILAKSGRQGLETAKKQDVDLILLDVEMPDWDGPETLRHLRNDERTADIPVIFLTSVNSKTHILDALKLQPQGYILKPVNKEELHTKINDIFFNCI